MNTKLLSALVILTFAPSLVFAARPSINELNTRVNQLEAENNAQQAEIDALNEQIADIEVCPSSSPPRFVDNGDGTICDHETGLMWEKKDAADGVEDFSSPNDVDNHYFWSSTGTAPDGPVFTDFLARLNNALGSPTDAPFAGHNDWRIPTVSELQTILLEPFPCSIAPCIDPVFGPTLESSYVSSTTDANIQTSVWVIFFGAVPSLPGGTVVSFDKDLNDIPVRAVRGGR